MSFTPTNLARGIPTVPRQWILGTVVLVGVFALPLFDLARFAAGSSLYSHAFLIPLVSAWLVWERRRSLPGPSRPSLVATITPALAAAVIMAFHWHRIRSGSSHSREDDLAATTSSFLLLFLSVCAGLLGTARLRAVAFPLGLLVFMVPLPSAILSAVETVLQHGSAAVAAALFQLSGTTVLHRGLEFQLPGITLQVAPECSGIHSSLALLITSLVAGYLFLRSPWSRAALALAVLPLALVRNGFRVFTIGELCVWISPDMINSYVHRQGGPIFFTLSLIPFLALLIVLRRIERSRDRSQPKST